MTNKLAVGVLLCGWALAAACSSSSTPKATGDAGGAGTGFSSAGTTGSAGTSASAGTSGSAGIGIATAGTSATAGTGAAGTAAAGTGAAGTAGTGAAGTGTAGTGAAGTGAAGSGATCDPGISSVAMCGTNSCPAVSGSAAECTVNCCTGQNQCGTRTAVQGQTPSTCRVPPTCDTGITSVSMCGSNACPAVSGTASACTVNCCDSMNQCGTRTAIQGQTPGTCRVPPKCDPSITSVTMCGTNTCTAPSATAQAQTCAVSCCDQQMRCGYRSAIQGMTTQCVVFGGGGPGGG